MYLDGKISLCMMRSLFEKKYWVLLISILALGALLVLSFGLETVTFDEPQPINLPDPDSSTNNGGNNTPALDGVSFELQIGLFISILLLAGLIGLLMTAEGRKRFLRLVFRLAVTYWILTYIIKKYPDIMTFLDLDPFTQPNPSTPGEAEIIPPAIFTPPQPTPLISYLISTVLVFVVLFAFWRLYKFWKDLHPARPDGALSDIARIARRTIKDLSSGINSTDVILNCYHRMSEVISEKKKIDREMSMTPSEFAVQLERSGLPGDAVRKLTRLFESVRYGNSKAGPAETREAVACLATILDYCGEAL